MTDSRKPAVLVVEDEVLIRLDFVSQLESQGLCVREAGSADEALSVLIENSSIVAVFTDLRMPGSMDGLALAREIRSRWPNLFIAICSGNDLPVVDRDQFDRLEKPYIQQDVADMIAKLNSVLPSMCMGDVTVPAPGAQEGEEPI